MIMVIGSHDFPCFFQVGNRNPAFPPIISNSLLIIDQLGLSPPRGGGDIPRNFAPRGVKLWGGGENPGTPAVIGNKLLRCPGHSVLL
jgi:hypothetical protein